jgi:hypothetical protein
MAVFCSHWPVHTAGQVFSFIRRPVVFRRTPEIRQNARFLPIPPRDGFLHDIRPHLTSHPPVCANKSFTKKTGRRSECLFRVVPRRRPGSRRPDRPFHADHRRLPVRRTRRLAAWPPRHGLHPIYQTQRACRWLHPICQTQRFLPNRRLHPICQTRRPLLPPRSALPNDVADLVDIASPATLATRTLPRPFRSHAGLRLPRAAYLGVLSLFAPRSPSVGLPRSLVLRIKLNIGGNIRLEQPWAGSV